MLKFFAKKFIITWSISCLIAFIISFFKDMINQNLKSSGSLFYNPYYKWTDFLLFFAIILLIICTCYFVLILSAKKTFKTFMGKEILGVVLSFFLIPLLIPYNSLADYLMNPGNFSILKEYFFDIMEIGIAGSCIPIIDEFVHKKFDRNDKKT